MVASMEECVSADQTAWPASLRSECLQRLRSCGATDHATTHWRRAALRTVAEGVRHDPPRAALRRLSIERRSRDEWDRLSGEWFWEEFQGLWLSRFLAISVADREWLRALWDWWREDPADDSDRALLVRGQIALGLRAGGATIDVWTAEEVRSLVSALSGEDTYLDLGRPEDRAWLALARGEVEAARAEIELTTVDARRWDEQVLLLPPDDGARRVALEPGRLLRIELRALAAVADGLGKRDGGVRERM